MSPRYICVECQKELKYYHPGRCHFCGRGFLVTMDYWEIILERRKIENEIDNMVKAANLKEVYGGRR